jgi:hypothetical protein
MHGRFLAAPAAILDEMRRATRLREPRFGGQESAWGAGFVKATARLDRAASRLHINGPAYPE